MVLSKPLLVSMLRVMVGLVAVGGTASAAENSTLTLNFGGSPGTAVPHSYDYGVPENAGEFYTMRVPVFIRSWRKFFMTWKLR